jgi:DNA-binding NarL/FixJ family response regulator
VCHAVGDLVVPFEEGRLIATKVRDATLVALDSPNHLLMAQEPAWAAFLRELDAIAPAAVALDYELSGRESEIVGLVSEGLSNDEIAARLVLSTRTVERHLSNVYVKWQLSGKAARAAAAARYTQLRSSARTT